MVAPSKSANLTLYRQLLRAAKGFSNYNFREYAVAHVRDDVRAAASLEGAQALDAFQHGMVQLEMLKRQAAVSSMFPTTKHAMEPDDGSSSVFTVTEKVGSRFD
mmetsp:Transcript_701/g.1895  ORF Transcript_701/g.1895 Transcript_701/m.1895 type:complete len:104 (+) Transcript_701:62-373(+)